jgi:RNA methyltransferase, TrmH family
MAPTRAQIKFLQSLQLKKYRQRYNKFGVEGEKICAELLRDCPEKVEMVLALPEWIEENRVLLHSYRGALESISEEVLRKISSLQTPNKVFLLAEMSPAPPQEEAVTRGLSLFLDGIHDPGNLGAIIRIADWFGVAAVFCAPNCVEWANPKTIQASMGSFFRVPIAYLPLDEVKTRFPALPVWGMDMDGESIYRAPIAAPALLVLGSESHGIAAESRPLIGSWLGIPPHPGSGAESLNAAVAAGIACALIRARG